MSLTLSGSSPAASQLAGCNFYRGLLDACRLITLDEGVVVGQKEKLSAPAPVLAATEGRI